MYSYIYARLFINIFLMGGNMRIHSHVFVVHLALNVTWSSICPFWNEREHQSPDQL